MTPTRYVALCITIFFSLFILAVHSGCSGGGKEDDTESTSSSSSEVDIVDCSGATFEGLDAEEVAQIVEEAEEGAEFVVEEQPVGLNQAGALRQLYKVTLIQGCGNTVVNEDNDFVSDDDVSTNISAGAPAQ